MNLSFFATDPDAAVYLPLCAFPLAFLWSLARAFFGSEGLRFHTEATREQGVLLAVLPAAGVLMGIVGHRPSLMILLLLVSAVIGYQAWGPKRWHKGKVSGATLVPVSLRSWSQSEDRISLQLALGYQLTLKDTPANHPFVLTLDRNLRKEP